VTFKYYFRLLKNRRRISSKELASKMAFIRPFSHEIKIADFVDREGFIRVALLLGVKYEPQQLCSLILWATHLEKPKKEKLLDWLIVNGFLKADIYPLPLSDYSKAINCGYYEHLQPFLYRFFNCVNGKTTKIRLINIKIQNFFEDRDPKGQNLLSSVVKKPRAEMMFLSHIKQLYGTQKLMELLTQWYAATKSPPCLLIRGN